jgi:hypothetical protein
MFYNHCQPTHRIGLEFAHALSEGDQFAVFRVLAKPYACNPWWRLVGCALWQFRGHAGASGVH